MAEKPAIASGIEPGRICDLLVRCLPELRNRRRGKARKNRQAPKRVVFAGPGQMLLVLLTTLCQASPLSAQPREFINLQVLPEDIGTREMFEVMKQMSSDLGAECQTCHRTDIRDFASDELPAKRKAREKMLMTQKMNLDNSSATDAQESRIQCSSCHRGKLKPADTALR
jgi:Photosynthetic reaction centre cytochrome C subunit